MRSEHQRQATDQASTGNTVTSLRLCATLDWSRYVERVSLVEQILRRDPAGGLPADGLPEPRPLPAGRGGALRADRRGAGARGAARGRERARAGCRRSGQRGPSEGSTAGRPRRLSPDRPGPARPRDRRRLHPPAPGQRLRRFVFAHATAAYLGGIGLLTGLGVFAAYRVRQGRGGSRDGDRRGAPRARPRERARHAPRAAARRRARSAAPASAPRSRRRRSRERPDDGRRPDASRERRRRRASPRAPRGAGAREPRPARPLRDPERLPGREDGHERRRRGDPRRRGRRDRGAEPPARARGERPLLPLPPRPPLEPEGRASSWGGSGSAGRSRSSTGSCAVPRTRRSRVQVGDLSILPSVRYVLTLDADSRLPRGAAGTLIGILVHPLNRPRSTRSRGG